MWHRARQRFVAGAVLLVLASACGSDAAVQTTDGSADGGAAAAALEVSAIPTTAVVTEPLPSPTPLSVEPPPALPTMAVPTAVVPTAVVPTAVVPTPAPPAVAPTADAPATAVPSSPPPATAAPATPAPISGSQQVLAANGAEVYTLNCARCHGENGLGTQQYSAGLVGVGSRYSTTGMVAELTTGHPVTFGFADRLSAEEIASVVAYVKSVFP